MRRPTFPSIGLLAGTKAKSCQPPQRERLSRGQLVHDLVQQSLTWRGFAMDQETRENVARAYELLRIQTEQIHRLTTAVRAMGAALLTDNPKAEAAYQSALAEYSDVGKSAEAQANEKALAVIDLVIAKLRSGRIGRA